MADAFKQVCGIVYPNNEEGKLRCEVMIDQYTPSIIELLVNQYLEPELFCTQLTMCP
jgi:hypothetical protein